MYYFPLNHPGDVFPVCVRFEQFNRKYLRRFLIREERQARSSILRVYQELERREQRGEEEEPP